MQTDSKTIDEVIEASTTVFRGIEMGLGQADPCVLISQKLEQQHPGHMILVQAGKFLHGYDRTAHILSTMKGYKLRLVGTSSDPHIQIGFPVAGFKRRMHEICEEYQTPYAAAIGSKVMDYTVVVSGQVPGKESLIASVSEGIVAQVIADLRQRGELNKAGAKQLLANPDTSGFKLKQFAQDLDNQITLDLIKLPRDVRTTLGESLRVVMQRIMSGVFAYGLSGNKIGVLHALSADIDHLKHQLAQAQRLSQVKIAFEHRAGLAVELGRLVGGLIRSAKVES